ncbi:tRNA1(Val) (adenine(37)-N6)-methyltransferase [Segetibacter aerophilus]|uniref:tRNA1(Val) (adenine(37)-N6)-methyltransferase n=1 Tax=Segetibacter aerophilus TaxID=670293 RepID=A0A512BAW7_9BACT|nr:methyltransferase [Segetibacter aerophilus]GEO09116.1 tRNA1(Val) (adenine(37)-N6)-methyltransferase [Segetibacter aerophilus]
MSNSYFQFKKFTVHQQKAAMKVCTDACLFGAWVAARMQGRKVERVLDIGTGTGLLSLMIAQKINAEITAVEIEEAATEQAEENFKLSPYAKRLTVVQDDIRKSITRRCFDLIITNPPFYNNDLKSEDQHRNVAMHSIDLSFDELLSQVNRLLQAHSFFAVLLPFFKSKDFILSAEKHKLFLLEQIHVRQTEQHGYFRSMLLFSRSISAQVQSELVIKKDNAYSEEFVRLLKDYYLYL